MSTTRLSARRVRTAATLIVLSCLAVASGVGRAAAQADLERFQIGLSTDRIGVGADFTGARLVVFGALDDADARLLRQQRYDIVIALVGPRRAVVVRQKERTFGLWINRGSETFNTAPASYAVASTRPLADIAGEGILSSFALGIENLQLNGRPVQMILPQAAAQGSARPSGPAPAPAVAPAPDPAANPARAGQPADEVEAAKAAKAGQQPSVPRFGRTAPEATSGSPPSRDAYAEALRRIREGSSLYNQSSSGVEFISRTLFRADLQLPADLPVGEHTVRAYLFKSGAYIRGIEKPLVVVKTGFESVIADFAKSQGVLYGLLAVALAILTGWFGRVLFKRD